MSMNTFPKLQFECLMDKTDNSIPQTKKEAFQQLDLLLTDEQKQEMRSASDPIEYHFSLGIWIRNNWIYGQDEDKIRNLARAFRMKIDDFIPFDPDELSDKIITSYMKY